MTRDIGTGKVEKLLETCKHLKPVPTAVVHPCEETALAGAMEAGAMKLITPVLVGPAAKIADVAKAGGIDLGQTRIVDVPHSHAAATKAVELVRQGEVELLMKGQFGKTVANHPPDLVPIPLQDVVGKTKTVPLDNDLLLTARALGVSFGD